MSTSSPRLSMSGSESVGPLFEAGSESAGPNEPVPGELIRLRGVRVHNLAGIDLDLPQGRLIAVTGVSGAGKSSLVLDTLHAEGQRRFIETLSPFARQFFQVLDKPDADLVSGLPPSIAVEPRAGGRRSARSTLATLTEVHDYLALLYAKLGRVVCTRCGSLVQPATLESMTAAILELPDRTRYQIAFPVDIGPETNQEQLVRSLREDGFLRIRIDGSLVELMNDNPPRQLGARLDVIVDRLVRGSDEPGRRSDSIATAFDRGLGRCVVFSDSREWTFQRGWRCAPCGAEYHAPEPGLFRFNTGVGACPTCEGLGRVMEAEGSAGDQTSVEEPSEARRGRRRGRTSHVCPDCQGSRLRPESLAVRLGPWNIAEFTRFSVDEALRSLGELALDTSRVGRQPARQARHRLESLAALGLGYLPLDRPARWLASGEDLRMVLASALGSGLVNVLYVFDEPTVSLHPHDVIHLVAALIHLRDAGNTVVVVEHDRAVLAAADLIVDLGPGAGDAGGRVVFTGPPADLVSALGSVTADYFVGRRQLPIATSRRSPDKGFLELIAASGHHLQNIDVAFPLGVFCAVSGVSGAGKSTLVEHTLYPEVSRQLGKIATRTPLPFRELRGVGAIQEVVMLDQAPIGRGDRSNPATYLKVYDEVRRTFAATHEARIRNLGPGAFSFNVEGGRCSSCQGHGHRLIDMQFLPDVLVTCPDCRGQRFRPEVLEVTYRGKTITQVLDLTARDAFAFFRHRPKVQTRLRPLIDVGLGYVRLGQAVATLSGGESQRLKLAAFLGSSASAITRAASGPKTLYLLDEPTAGLHPADIAVLLDALNRLVDIGSSLIVVEHNISVLASADWVIDIGPGAGPEGGRIVAQGTPEDVAQSGTFTGQAIAEELRTAGVSRLAAGHQP